MIYINDRLDQIDLEAAMSRLSAQRREQALRFRFELGRRQCAAAYLLLCTALEQEYGITEPPLFEYGEHGKPRLAPLSSPQLGGSNNPHPLSSPQLGGSNNPHPLSSPPLGGSNNPHPLSSPLQRGRPEGAATPPPVGGGWEGAPFFNLSHCREAVACVLSTQPVGIDIESIRPIKESLVRYTMNDAEQELIFSAPNPDVAFTRLWTRKEAVMKLSGHGLVNDMKSVLDNCSAHLLTVARPDRGYVWSVAM